VVTLFEKAHRLGGRMIFAALPPRKALLNEYVDGTVDPGICKEFEEHMAGCNPCQVVVDNIRKTITLYKQGKPFSRG
jgi:anti-sigma factor RsiW